MNVVFRIDKVYEDMQNIHACIIASDTQHSAVLCFECDTRILYTSEYIISIDLYTVHAVMHMYYVCLLYFL